MTKVLVTLVSVVFVAIILEFIIPNSSFNKYIKVVLGMVLINVVLASFIEFKDSFSDDKDSILSSTLYNINKAKLDSIMANITYLLKTQDLGDVEVEIECDLYSSCFNIDKINVDISNLVLNGDVSIIHIKDKIQKLILTASLVDSNKVVFYE
ncbi:MAG: stage III sporulation protein AF [Clostridia bacterium]|nr:stage III sporulation protein AF [Clostridia bacterium]